MGIEFDDTDFQKRLEKLTSTVDKEAVKNMELLGNEILRLSVKEVPIHTVPGEPGGALQNSSFVEPGNGEVIIGYNMAYAAYQHEGRRKDGSHVVTQYTNPRSKPKFLEDPIKNNITMWGKLFLELMRNTLSHGTY